MPNDEFNYEKVPYYAFARQWDGRNTPEIVNILGDKVQVHDSKHLVVRYGNDIYTLTLGWWVVRGENGKVKCYADDVFRTKYRPIAGRVIPIRGGVCPECSAVLRTNATGWACDSCGWAIDI